MRVSLNTATKWKREGCPHFLVGSAAGRGCRARFELDKVKAWLEARTKADKVQDATAANKDAQHADKWEQSRGAVAKLEAKHAAKAGKEMR